MDALEQEFYERVGQRVRAARNKAGLTQSQLGSHLHPPMVKASIALIESGGQRVNAYTLFQIAQVVKKSLHELTAGTKVAGTPPEALKLLKQQLEPVDVREIAKSIRLFIGFKEVDDERHDGEKSGRTGPDRGRHPERPRRP